MIGLTSAARPSALHSDAVSFFATAAKKTIKRLVQDSGH
jgi:hypothetical protein